MDQHEHTSPEIACTPLAHVSSRCARPGDVWFSERWFELTLGREPGGMLNLTVAYHCRPRWEGECDRPHTAIFACATGREAHRILNDYDYRRHVRVDHLPDGRLDFVEDTVRYVDDIVLNVRSAVRRLLPSLSV